METLETLGTGGENFGGLSEGGRDELKLWIKSAKRLNKEAHIVNGNGDSKIKLVCWNLGSRRWKRKTDDIIHMLDDLKPDLAVITEANLQYETEAHERNIPGYSLTTTKDYENGGMSQLVVLVRMGLNIRVLETMKEDDISTIWMEIPRKGLRPVTIGALYREHHLLGYPAPNNTDDPHLQKNRWDKILNQWTSIQNQRDVVVLGDFNIDYKKWTQPEQCHLQLVNGVKDKIETLGYTQMVRGPTRFWRDTIPSLIDMVWMNCPTKMIHCKNIPRPVADHNLVEVLLRLKGNPKVKMEALRRKWKKLDVDLFRNEIEEIDWEKIYSIKDADLAYNFLEENMRRALDQQIPVARIQPCGRKRNWISENTKNCMILRDAARSNANATNEANDWSEFRKWRNKVTELVRKDRKKYFQELYKSADESKDTRTLYRVTK